jgi:TRAP-type C4-dicarboxylate transport system substrate-binding protein
MEKDRKKIGLISSERRRFLKVSACLGVTSAMVALSRSASGSEESSAQVVRKEAELKAAAAHTMILGTAYPIGVSRSYPIMQLDFKENIQNTSKGAIYVQLVPGGKLGGGSALAHKVQTGTIQAAQHSISNFAPFAPAADVINIPYWCGQNQKFVNLVTSEIWKNEINPKVEARGFKALWYPCIDPRTIAVRKGVKGPIKTPEQMQGIKFRVPNSKILQRFYRKLGANPIPVEWVEAANAMKRGYTDALDPSVEALFVFGFKDLLSSITFNAAVPDAQVYSCNLKWFESLPSDVQESVEFASEITMRQNHAKIPAARAYAMAEMKKAGVEFYVPTADEMAQWVEKAGAQLPIWNDIKKELLGSLPKFDKLLEAANRQSNYYVHDV